MQKNNDREYTEITMSLYGGECGAVNLRGTAFKGDLCKLAAGREGSLPDGSNIRRNVDLRYCATTSEYIGFDFLKSCRENQII